MANNRLAFTTFILTMIATVSAVDAAEIKGLFAGGIGVVTRELTPMFERTSGHKVTVTYRVVGGIKDLLQRGETADVIIVPPRDLDDLQKQGKVLVGTRVDIAKTGIGVVIRAGAPKPDVSSVEAFKRTLLAAKSFGYVDPAGGAAPSIPIANMFERIGIAADLKAKAKFVPNGRSLYEAIVKQEVEIGVYIINEIVTTPGVELAGPLPPDLQFYMMYSAGIMPAAHEPELARELIKFLSSPAALPIIRAKGMEPG